MEIIPEYDKDREAIEVSVAAVRTWLAKWATRGWRARPASPCGRHDSDRDRFKAVTLPCDDDELKHKFIFTGGYWRRKRRRKRRRDSKACRREEGREAKLQNFKAANRQGGEAKRKDGPGEAGGGPPDSSSGRCRCCCGEGRWPAKCRGGGDGIGKGRGRGKGKGEDRILLSSGVGAGSDVAEERNGH